MKCAIVHGVGFVNNRNTKNLSNIYFKSDCKKNLENSFCESIDGVVYKGQRPSEQQMIYLKNQLGISTIIDFSTETFHGTSPTTEQNVAKQLNLKYFWIPFCSDANPEDKDIDLFFDIINKAKQNHEKVYIHCLQGKDRTGLMTEIYRLKNNLSSYEESLHRLIKSKYNFENNPTAIYLLKKIR